jgi:hypothetical protein
VYIDKGYQQFQLNFSIILSVGRFYHACKSHSQEFCRKFTSNVELKSVSKLFG